MECVRFGKSLAKNFLVIGIVVLIVHVVTSIFLTGSLWGLVNSSSTFAVEQGLGTIGYILSALASPVVSALFLLSSLGLFLAVRDGEKSSDTLKSLPENMH